MDSDIRKGILDRLMEYGDKVLGEDNTQSQSGSSGTSRKATNDVANKREKIKKKKIKKKKEKVPTALDAGHSKSKSSEKREKQSSMKDFEEELRTFMETVKVEKEKEKEEENTMERRKDGGGKRRKAPEVIVFNDPTKRKRDRTGESSRDGAKPNRRVQEQEEDDEDGFEIETARHDVWKYAISGLTFEDKEKREAAKAIQLGAKAPRRENVNYKELIEMKKRGKEDEREQREVNRLMGLKTGKKSDDKIHLKNKGFWTDSTQKKGVYIDGQLGKYKRGVQVITKKDMSKVKSSGGRGGKR